MKYIDLFNKLMSGEIDNLQLNNEDASELIRFILNKGQLNNFKITINSTKGKTLFQKR